MQVSHQVLQVKDSLVVHKLVVVVALFCSVTVH